MQTAVIILSILLALAIAMLVVIRQIANRDSASLLAQTIRILEHEYPGVSGTFIRLKGRVIHRARMAMYEREDHQRLRVAVSQALASLEIMSDTATKSGYTWVLRDVDEIKGLFKSFS